ncbi:S-phase kinase-associated protein 1-like, partial [Dromiciops gliroides]|uniref:S-phase kinase-associated protein 1-like n=1 Tax=Dromiciops gliroides TaxID=33562 RepID=UPI001CC79B21
INLQSYDGEIFVVDSEIEKHSVTVKTILQDMGMDDKGDDDLVPLPNVRALRLKTDPPYPSDDNKNKKKKDIPVWDQEFLKVGTGTFFELILVTIDLDMKDLPDVTCKIVSNIIKGLPPVDIQETFNTKNDFTIVVKVSVDQNKTKNKPIISSVKWCAYRHYNTVSIIPNISCTTFYNLLLLFSPTF